MLHAIKRFQVQASWIVLEITLSDIRRLIIIGGTHQKQYHIH